MENMLDRGAVLMHPYVVGELALGVLRPRAAILGMLLSLPAAITVTPDEVLDMIDIADLSGAGIGYVDAHLLASARMTQDGKLATRDRRLQAAAERLGLLARFD